MTRVDFYVLPEDSENGPGPTAASLCEKAVLAGHKVHIHAPDETAASQLDKLLWTFKQGSFLAHERLSGTPQEPLPAVLIGAGEPLASHHNVLINLDEAVPGFFSRFERVLEIVHGDTAARAKSRERFKFYRDRGYALETHKL